MRLNRFLSASGVASRRRAESIIKAGRVIVNGEKVTDPARDVSPENDTVIVDGVKRVVADDKRYYVMNKPTGAIVSRGDTHRRKTVYDILGPETKGVFAVGRLDLDTTGVLFFTDDGDLTHRLMHPSWEVGKVYRAQVAGKVTQKEVEIIGKGIELEDGPVSPALMKILRASETRSEVELVLHEGRKRQVRLMLRHIGHRVNKLDRISFGNLTATGVALGAYRPLTFAEVLSLKKLVKLI